MNAAGEESQYMHGQTTGASSKKKKRRTRFKIDVPLPPKLIAVIDREAARQAINRVALIRAILSSHYFSKDLNAEVRNLTDQRDYERRHEMIDRLMYELARLGSTISAIPAPDLSLGAIVVFEALLESYSRIEESLIKIMRLVAMDKDDERHLDANARGLRAAEGPAK